MSGETSRANVADGSVLDSDHGRSDLVGNTMLSTWDVVSVAIYFLLVMGIGIYVSKIFNYFFIIHSAIFRWKCLLSNLATKNRRNMYHNLSQQVWRYNTAT